MQTESDSLSDPSKYASNIPFENLEWVSTDEDWRITSRTLVFKKVYRIYHKGVVTGYTYDIFGEALDYALAHAEPRQLP